MRDSEVMLEEIVEKFKPFNRWQRRRFMKLMRACVDKDTKKKMTKKNTFTAADRPEASSCDVECAPSDAAALDVQEVTNGSSTKH